MAGYGDCAVTAVSMMSKKEVSPADAWESATKKAFGSGGFSQKKSCPKGAFLGLCENGDVIGVHPRIYTKSILNKKYAIDAVLALRSNPGLASDKNKLWKQIVPRKGKQHNGQMDVVLAL